MAEESSGRVVTHRQAAEKMEVSERWVRKLMVRLKTEWRRRCSSHLRTPFLKLRQPSLTVGAPIRVASVNERWQSRSGCPDG